MWRKRANPVSESERVIKDRDKARERTMNRAVKLLAAKPRSVGELRGRLMEKGWTDSAIVDEVIAKLKGYGYLDDEQFARDMAVSKLRQKPQGRRRLRQTMSRKMLDRETVDTAIDSAFATFPEDRLIDSAIDKRLRLKGRPETREDAKKFYEHLLRQGFDFDLIRQKMADLVKNDDAQ